MTQSVQKDQFDLEEAFEALEAIPGTLRAFLASRPEVALDYSEDAEAWSPRKVLVHFIHNEQTNWLPRMRVILSDDEAKTFASFNQMPEQDELPELGTGQLLDQFAQLREANILEMRGFEIGPEDLDREGEHPALGTVNLKQLSSTWVVHDLNHLHQIAKSLAKRYRDTVGPWRENLAILDL